MKKHQKNRNQNSSETSSQAAPARAVLRQRWEEFYATPGGPLLAWLQEEAQQRGMSFNALAQDLGVTTGYLRQLEVGTRQVSDISDHFAAACGVFLQVPMVVVLVIAGRLRLVDFVAASDLDRWIEDFGDEEDAAGARMRCGLTLEPGHLSILPVMVSALREAAVIHQVRSQVS